MPFLRLTLDRMHSQRRTSPARHAKLYRFAASLLLLACTLALYAQEGFHTETSTGVSNIRIAGADFKPLGADPQTQTLKTAFDTTLYADLANAAISDVVLRSLLPQSTPGAPAEINIAQWSVAPASAAMIA